MKCFHTSIFIETPSLQGLPTKAKENPSPHEIRVSLAGHHQPSISYLRDALYSMCLIFYIIMVVIIIIIIVIVIIIIILNFSKTFAQRNLIFILNPPLKFQEHLGDMY